jgi:hypothetical protein
MSGLQNDLAPGRAASEPHGALIRAFSGEVDTGSREENASKQKARASVPFNRNEKALVGAVRKTQRRLAEYDRRRRWLEAEP